MSKILIAGAGGTPSENVIKSLLECEKNETIIGMGSEPSDLILSKASKKYIIPYAVNKKNKNKLLQILNVEKPDLVHFQNDIEILEASRLRESILSTGTKLYMKL